MTSHKGGSGGKQRWQRFSKGPSKHRTDISISIAVASAVAIRMWVDIIEKVGNGSIKTAVFYIHYTQYIQTADDSQDVWKMLRCSQGFFTTLNVKYRSSEKLKHPLKHKSSEEDI